MPDPNVSIVRECRPLPVEFVYRAYLTGSTSTSIWTAYARGERVYCGHRLPDGLRRHEPLPQPLLTPTTKAPQGEHDELTSRAELIARGTLSEAESTTSARASPLRSSRRGSRFAASRGLILVDTKYELGLDDDGERRGDRRDPHAGLLALLVPRRLRARARSRPRSRGARQGVRAALARRAAATAARARPPSCPIDVRCEAARRYIEAFEQLTGRGFEPDPEPPLARIRRNLGALIATHSRLRRVGETAARPVGLRPMILRCRHRAVGSHPVRRRPARQSAGARESLATIVSATIR